MKQDETTILQWMSTFYLGNNGILVYQGHAGVFVSATRVTKLMLLT